jgi:hypothetical protein
VWSVPFEPLGVPIGVVHILACLTLGEVNRGR